jgi:hypothetical protein
VGQDGERYTTDLQFRKSRIFLREGLDKGALICPSGHRQEDLNQGADMPKLTRMTKSDIILPALPMRTLGGLFDNSPVYDPSMILCATTLTWINRSTPQYSEPMFAQMGRIGLENHEELAWAVHNFGAACTVRRVQSFQRR